MMNEQLQWNYQSEIAPLFPDHAPIKALCQMIDTRQAKGRKTGDLEEQLLKLAYNNGTPQQWNETLNYVKGCF